MAIDAAGGRGGIGDSAWGLAVRVARVANAFVTGAVRVGSEVGIVAINAAQGFAGLLPASGFHDADGLKANHKHIVGRKLVRHELGGQAMAAAAGVELLLSGGPLMSERHLESFGGGGGLASFGDMRGGWTVAALAADVGNVLIEVHAIRSAIG